MNEYVIDRIEELFAVCEHGDGFTYIPLPQLPEGAREGSLLLKTEDGWQLGDNEERRRQMAERRRKLMGGGA